MRRSHPAAARRSTGLARQVWARGAWPLALVLAALGVAGCGGGQGEARRAASETAPPTGQSFDASLDALCAPLAEKSAETTAPASRREAERLARELLDAQRTFLGRAGELDPPPAVADDYADYLAGVRSLVALNERSLEGTASRREQHELALQAAQEGVETFEAKEAAELPDSCPPTGGEAYVFLFQATANAACFDLGPRLRTLAREQARTDSRAETARLIEEIHALAADHAAAIEDAVPYQLRDPRLDRMLALYHRRVQALGRVRRTFLGRDEAAFDAAMREQGEASAEADELAADLGLGECIRLVQLGA